MAILDQKGDMWICAPCHKSGSDTERTKERYHEHKQL